MTVDMRPGDRIAAWFVSEAPREIPDRVLDEAFDRTRTMPQVRARTVDRLVGGRRTALLLAAAVAMILALVGSAVVGRFVVRPVPTPSPDALQLVRNAGTLRIAVGAIDTSGGSTSAFQDDVGRELGRRIGVDPDVVVLPSTELLGGSGAWDVGLPLTADWSIDPIAFVVTPPFYAWPHLLVVPAGSGAETLDDVRGQPICAVTGDAGQRWLLGTDGPSTPGRASSAPIASSLILRPSDGACMAAVTDGLAVAAVTATMSPSDVAARPELRAIGGPPTEPRAAVIRRGGPDPVTLAAAVEQALAEMHADGTLARLSAARFGGDLTTP